METDRHVIAVLVHLASGQKQNGNSSAAIGALQQAVAIDPLHEEAHQRALRLLVQTGRRRRGRPVAPRHVPKAKALGLVPGGTAVGHKRSLELPEALGLRYNDLPARLGSVG